ncbi:MAG: hypothetical protein HQL51_07695 [Magnetococcales bacterium]|nr:hypothetical protein [Magnetococcales bacterium]
MAISICLEVCSTCLEAFSADSKAASALWLAEMVRQYNSGTPTHPTSANPRLRNSSNVPSRGFREGYAQ